MRVWALAALQAAVTIAWMAYGYFQPRLLARFGFESLAGLLAWYLAFAGTTLAPLAGDASDRLVRSGGDRFPVVRAGVALAAASFVAVAVTARAEAGGLARFVLPLFVAIWIAGMTVFQAPALALVRDVAAPGEVPSALSPVVVATTLPLALWPWIEPALAALGGAATFLAGGVAVVATAAALGRSVAVPVAAPRPNDGARGGSVLVAFACGLASAAVVVLATDLVPGAIARDGAAGRAALAGLAASLVAALAAPLVRALGAVGALVGGLAIALACRAVAPWCAGAIGAGAVSVLAGAGLGLHLGAALPFVLSAQPAGRAGLTTGLYLAGAVVGSQVARALTA